MQRKRLRLKNYDYSQEGAYFVTICTKEGCDYFGKIKEGYMALNDAGRMVERIWKEIPQNYPGIEINEFIVMPNHMHGIIKIVGAGPRARPCTDKLRPAQGPARTYKISLSEVMHRFKSLTTAIYRKNFSNDIINFNGKLWHRSFHVTLPLFYSQLAFQFLRVLGC